MVWKNLLSSSGASAYLPRPSHSLRGWRSSCRESMAVSKCNTHVLVPGLSRSPTVNACDRCRREMVRATRIADTRSRGADYGAASGLWEHWVASGGQAVESCTIVMVDGLSWRRLMTGGRRGQKGRIAVCRCGNARNDDPVPGADRCS